MSEAKNDTADSLVVVMKHPSSYNVNTHRRHSNQKQSREYRCNGEQSTAARYTQIS